MSDENLVLATLLGIKNDLGELKGSVNALKESFEQHVVEDDAVEKRVSDLETSVNKTRWILVGAAAVFAAAAKIIAALFFRGN